MSKKKKNQMIEDMPIDKVDQFLQKNFQKLLIGVAALIVVFLAGYGITGMLENSRLAKIDALGRVEATLSVPTGVSVEEIYDFRSMANVSSDVKDYVLLRSAQLFYAAGNVEEAKATLAQVSGEFAELRDSMLADLGGTVSPQQYVDKGAMSPVWYYRSALAAPKEATALVAEFKTKYPNNRLVELLDNWGVK